MSPKSDAAPGPSTIHMNVRKRNGSLEPINLEKVVKAVTRSARAISDVDPARVAAKTIGSIYDGATTQELDKFSIETAASLNPEHSNYFEASPYRDAWMTSPLRSLHYNLAIHTINAKSV